jgi:hypothetical protein
MTKSEIFPWVWILLKNGFYIILSCFLMEKGAVILSLLILVFIFVDLAVDFLRMIDE